MVEKIMKCSFIILNYNRADLTERCLSSVEAAMGGLEKEIIVVDNGSRDEVRKELRRICRDRCRLVQSNVNKGFGAGMDNGATEAEGKYLCFVNSDITFSEDCISPLIGFMESHPQVGIMTPQELNSEGRPVPSFKHRPGLCHDLFGNGMLEWLMPRRFLRRKKYDRTEPFAVAQVNGSLLLMRADVFHAVGGFDPEIFLYYEEYDICTRLAKAGYTAMVYPTAHFHHLHGGSTERSHWRLKVLMRSKLYTYRKHNGWLLWQLFRAENALNVLRKPYKWYLLPVVFASSPSAAHRP
ncbi:MAG: glycosyltransferase family 2 protein [Bacteroidaceae bacterium]|nr:glycosyltransferase family 2 protein [Bacteroidaceae bacterium]